MFTSKEMQYLKENLENENLLVTKFGSYSQQACDAEVKQICTDIQNCHKQHIQQLSNQLRNE